MLLEKNIIKHAVINEKDPLLFYFWKCVLENNEDLVKKIVETEINIETWRECALYRNEEYLKNKTPVEIGFAALYLNRTNFSGILKANPIGGLDQKSSYKLDCRFNKDAIISSIINISNYAEKITVCNCDAIVFMQRELRYKRNSKTFVYIDPPYFCEGPGLYRYYYKQDQHIQLATYIKKKAFPWLISYDDAIEIRKLYSSKTCVDIYLDYSVKTSKKGKELLISNLMIPPINQEKTQVNIIC